MSKPRLAKEVTTDFIIDNAIALAKEELAALDNLAAQKEAARLIGLKLAGIAQNQLGLPEDIAFGMACVVRERLLEWLKGLDDEQTELSAL